jgi:hypothetical protein
MVTDDEDDEDEISSKGNQSALSLSLDTISGSLNIPFDGHLQWILKYHLAMCSHMQQDYSQSQQVRSLPYPTPPPFCFLHFFSSSSSQIASQVCGPMFRMVLL